MKEIMSPGSFLVQGKMKKGEKLALVAPIVKAYKWENVYLEMRLGLDRQHYHTTPTTTNLSRKYK